MDIRKQRRSQNFIDYGYGQSGASGDYEANGNALPYQDYIEGPQWRRTINMPPPYRDGYDLSLTDIARLNDFQYDLWANAPFVEPLPPGFAPRDMNRREGVNPGAVAIPRPRYRRGLQQALR